MATTLTVFAYGNVDALHGIFNAIAMITSADDFKGMMRIGVLIGFVVIATLAMFPDHLRRGISWFMTVAVFTGVVTLTKADVVIVDHLGYQPPVAVSNVPYMLALMASVKTAIGSTLTQMFETAFQTIPDPTGKIVLESELSYIDHGVMFGSRLVRISREADFGSLYTQGDTYNYLRNCIFPSQGRDQLADQIENSTDLKSIFANPNPALGSAYHDPANNYALVFATCDVVYNKLAPLLNQEGILAVARASKRTFPDLPPALAQAKFEASLMAIYTKGAIAGASTNAAEVMLQNIWINATADASALYGASLNDPSLIMFASMRSQAVQSMNAGNLVAGRIAEEALPMIRNAIDAILYAVWPLICILAMISEGRALGAMLKSYLLTLAWVELWPPLFAVTNYLQTLEAAKHLAAAGVTSSGQGLTLGTATGIYSSAVSDVAIAAYMVTAVPIIAAAVVWGMEKIASVVGAASGSRQAQQETASGSKGNMSLGNVSMQQQLLAAQITEPATYTRTGVGGSESINLLTGERISHAAMSKFPVSLEDMQQIGQQASQSTAVAVDRATSSQKSFSQANEATMNEALAFARGAGTSATKSLSFDVSKVGSDGLSAEEKLATSRRINEQFKIGDASAVGKALELGLNGAGKGSIASRTKSLAGALGSTLGAKVSSSEVEDLAKAIVNTSDAMRSLGDARRHELVNQVRSGQSFEQARRSNREGGERVESSARNSETWQITAASDLREAESYRKSLDKFRALSRMSKSDWANHFDQFLQRKGISVPDGIAHTGRMQSLLLEFAASGELVRIDDETRFIPDQGVGPQFVREDFKGITISGLRADYAEANPGGGRGRVNSARSANDGKVTHRQSAEGVRPRMTIPAGDLQAQVDAAQAAAAKEIKAIQGASRQEGGKKQTAFDKRADTVSDYHRPVISNHPITGDSIRNKALDGVRGTDGSLERPFAEEASEIDRENGRRSEQLGKPGRDIPK